MDNFEPGNFNRNNNTGNSPDREPKTIIIRILPYLLIPILLASAVFMFNSQNRQTKSEYYEIVALFEDNKV